MKNSLVGVQRNVNALAMVAPKFNRLYGLPRRTFLRAPRNDIKKAVEWAWAKGGRSDPNLWGERKIFDFQ